ncbi:UNVERIFIED_ORG: putative damage-inducible protein DinB [Shinella zoogloeoides]|nr:putative damage-inducible protein DinB [Shinella zoogloeoides]
MHDHYRMFCAYNSWANARLYDAVAKLDDADFRRDLGAFFRSLHGTLNHLLAADRIWLKRFTGEGDAPTSLAAILYEDFEGLHAARQREDERLSAFIDSLSEAQIAADVTYSPLSNPGEITHPLGLALTHVFNHQTHHRGQCHAMLTALGGPSVPLDLTYFVRSEGKAFLHI